MVIPPQWDLSAESEKPNQLCVLPPGRRLIPMGRRRRLERHVGSSCPVVARRAKSEARRAEPEAGGEINTLNIAPTRIAKLGPSRFA